MHSLELSVDEIKSDLLDLFFGTFDFKNDFIFSATWYDICAIPWQLPSRKSRTASRSGAVTLLVQENIHVNRLEDFCCITNDYEVLSFLCSRIVYCF